jgi:hypothetical protein
MAIEVIPIADRASWLALRERDVTASVVGALLGVHEYTTAYGLWALKSGRLPVDTDETAAMRRGRLLEPVAVQLIREERPEWRVENPGVYLRDPAIRLGATPDLYVDCPERGPGIVQIKTTADMVFRAKWRDPDTREPNLPLWIACQAITEAHLSGRQWAAVAVMVVGIGLDLHIIDVPIHRRLIERIQAETVKFWSLLESGKEPDPDYGRDGSVIERLFAEDDGGEIDLVGDNRIHQLLSDRRVHKGVEKNTKAAIAAIDAEIKHKMGNAAVAHIGFGEIITNKTIRRAGYTAKPSVFRQIRVPNDGSAS